MKKQLLLILNLLLVPVSFAQKPPLPFSPPECADLVDQIYKKAAGITDAKMPSLLRVIERMSQQCPANPKDKNKCYHLLKNLAEHRQAKREDEAKKSLGAIKAACYKKPALPPTQRKLKK